MAISFTSKKCIRKSFGRVPEVAPMPNLIEVQKSSYDHFLQMGVAPEQRAAVGLQEVFKSVFPYAIFPSALSSSSSAMSWKRPNTKSMSANSAALLSPRR